MYRLLPFFLKFQKVIDKFKKILECWVILCVQKNSVLGLMRPNCYQFGDYTVRRKK